MEECPETSVLALSVSRQCKVHVTSFSERSKSGVGRSGGGEVERGGPFLRIALMDGRAQTLHCFSCFHSNHPANRSLIKAGVPLYCTHTFFCFLFSMLSFFYRKMKLGISNTVPKPYLGLVSSFKNGH